MELLPVGLFLLFWVGTAINAWKVILIDDRRSMPLKDWPGAVMILITSAAIPIIVVIALMK